MRTHLVWRWKRIGIVRVRKGVKVINRYWEPFSSSLRMQSQVEPHSLMPVMGSAS